MASGIYIHTMRRTNTGDSNHHNGTEGETASNSNTAGQDARKARVYHTLYVDHLVARRARSRSKHLKIRRLQILNGLLVFGLILVAIGWILAWAMYKQEQKQFARVEADLLKTRGLLVQAQQRSAQQEKDLALLVENRIPGLREIKYNKLEDVNRGYVLNISFSKAGTTGSNALEYHAVLLNNGLEKIVPSVEVIVFDDYGIQVGVVRLDMTHTTIFNAPDELEPGETRSYHSRIDIERGATPKYYLVHVD